MVTNTDEQKSCSFCQKTEDKAGMLIDVGYAAICEACVLLCGSMLDDRLGRVCFYENSNYALSNFSSFGFVFRGRFAATAEHHWQAEKFIEPDLHEMILTAPSAYDAKRLAQGAMEHRRRDWTERKKLRVMEEILEAKHDQIVFVQHTLRNTRGKLIVENSPADSFWGWGPDRQGRNELGKIWMKIYTKYYGDTSSNVVPIRS